MPGHPCPKRRRRRPDAYPRGWGPILGMKRGTNHKVGEFQPLKGLAYQWIAKRSLWRGDGRLAGSSSC